MATKKKASGTAKKAKPAKPAAKPAAKASKKKGGKTAAASGTGLPEPGSGYEVLLIIDESKRADVQQMIDDLQLREITIGLAKAYVSP